MPSQSHIDVPYGDHKRQILDAWIPDITGPLPWLAFFHGGGFIGGDKSRLPDNFREACLDAGIAVLSANYRFVDDTAIYDIVDDVSTVLDFALEQDWPLDPERLALAGSSAGSGMALCAGLGPEAERVKAIISYNGQFSYDFTLWKEALGALPEHHPSRAPALYHVEDHDALEADALAPMRQKLDMLGLISDTACPLLLYCDWSRALMHEDYSTYVHSPRHQEILAGRCAELDIPYELYLRDGQPPYEGDIHEESLNFLKKYLI